MPYNITEHRHRYNAWAASRAASTKTCRFKVAQGVEILVSSGLQNIASSPQDLPSAENMDETHEQWRERVIEQAMNRRLAQFGHGVAAKLINVYLKGMLVCGGFHENPRVQALHPPVDRVLLDALYKHDLSERRVYWKQARDTGWSRFSAGEYQSVITEMRHALGGRPLWEIEEFWQGYQGRAA